MIPVSNGVSFKPKAGVPLQIIKNEFIVIVINVKNGNNINNTLTGFWRLNAIFRIKVKNKYAIIPVIAGEINHEITISDNFVALIEFIPLDANANPQIDPIVECVVDTGYLKNVAIVNQIPAAKQD